MKRILSMLLVLTMLFGCSAAMAADLGVQVIGGSDAETGPASLDNLQLEATVEVPGWGDITPVSYDESDCIMVRKPGQLGKIWLWSYSGSSYVSELGAWYKFEMEVKCKEHGDEEYPWWCEGWVTHYQSKSQADFALLTMDILNTTTAKVDYLKNCTVKVIFDNNIEYAGWCYQRDLDLNRCTWIDPADNFTIDPYYVGHYVFGCTLPNAIFTSKKPLRMVITMDDKELTYNIRK